MEGTKYFRLCFLMSGFVHLSLDVYICSSTSQAHIVLELPCDDQAQRLIRCTILGLCNFTGLVVTVYYGSGLGCFFLLDHKFGIPKEEAESKRGHIAGQDLSQFYTYTFVH